MSSYMKAASLNGNLLARKGTALPAKLVAGPGRGGKKSGESDGSGQNTPATSKALPESRPGDGEGRARITLRLDPDRHLKLKLAAAHLRRSSQQILVEALDSYLKSSVPILVNDECGCLGSASRAAPGKVEFSGKTRTWDN